MSYEMKSCMMTINIFNNTGILDMLCTGAYTGFFLGGCGRAAPEIFFWHPGAKLLCTHPFCTHPPFCISPFLDQIIGSFNEDKRKENHGWQVIRLVMKNVPKFTNYFCKFPVGIVNPYIFCVDLHFLV